MKYISTRGKAAPVTAAQAILRGIAPDGGLYLPETLPAVDSGFIERLCTLDYPSRAKAILTLFLGDYTETEISECVESAYSDSFEDNRPAPLAQLGEHDWLLELWHGPTCAFKDMALQLLPSLLSLAMTKVGRGRRAIILTATSGDTGKAALEGFRDVPGVGIMVFYPEHGVSPMQKRQMYTQQGGNVDIVAIDGNFDDAQNGVKAIFGDAEFGRWLEEQGCMLTSANSINWGRLLPQIVYYFSAYCDLVAEQKLRLGDKISFCVPTGNFGNILAAHYARRMGLPVEMLVCASNRNHILTDHIRTGVYDRNRPFYPTSSPSMDILISSNLERLLFELCGCDGDAVCSMMQSLREKGRFELNDSAKNALCEGFWGGFCDENSTAGEIRRTFEQYGYLCDPHTAVAVNVVRQYRKAAGADGAPMVTVSTASPYKFASSVLQALGGTAKEDDFETAHELSRLTATAIPAPILALETATRRFDKTVPVSGMQDAVRSFALGG